MILDERTEILKGCSQNVAWNERLSCIILRHVFYIIWGMLPRVLTSLIPLPFVCGKEHSVSFFPLPLYTGRANEKLILQL